MSGAYEICSSRRVCKEMSLRKGLLPFVIHQNGIHKLSFCMLVIPSHKVCTNLHVHTYTHVVSWGQDHQFKLRLICSMCFVSLRPSILRLSYSCIMLLSPENLHFASLDFFCKADCPLFACSYSTVFHFQHDSNIIVISIDLYKYWPDMLFSHCNNHKAYLRCCNEYTTLNIALYFA